MLHGLLLAVLIVTAHTVGCSVHSYALHTPLCVCLQNWPEMYCIHYESEQRIPGMAWPINIHLMECCDIYKTFKCAQLTIPLLITLVDMFWKLMEHNSATVYIHHTYPPLYLH